MSRTILINAPELAARLRDPQLAILDATVLLAAPRFDGDYRAASGRERYLQAHIPGAVFADLLGDLSDHAAPFHFAMPSPGALVEALRRLGVADGQEIVIYDGDSGLWAARLWWMLRSIGIAARVLDGGLKHWQTLNLPLESGDSAGPGGAPAGGGSLSTRIDAHAWADRAQVEAIVRHESPGTLVCALSADVYHGKVPTRYARRGHIPGSRNFPARDLFESDGTYASPEKLAHAAHTALEASNRPLVLYCGGGISAAANALALTLLGESDIKIYDGSLEEWAADPNLPLEVGT